MREKKTSIREKPVDESQSNDASLKREQFFILTTIIEHRKRLFSTLCRSVVHLRNLLIISVDAQQRRHYSLTLPSSLL